jgi:hypothetical protein
MKHYVRIVLALILCCLFTVGCSSRVGPDEAMMEPLDGPGYAVRQYLDAWIASDYDMVSKLMDQENPVPNSSLWQYQLMRSLLARDTYKVGATTVKGDTAEVAVAITAVDCRAIAARMGTNRSREDWSNAISDPQATTTTLNVTLRLRKKDKSWIIAAAQDADVMDALTGGLNVVIMDIQQGGYD